MGQEGELQVGFVGNPNCGKTTLFNAYTGARLKTANWPGVTVEKKEGTHRYRKQALRLVDLPGIYSLTSYTMEEILTRQFLLNAEVDVIVDVADASALERSLYLTLQLIELGRPVVLALNMMDLVRERGMQINLQRLQKRLGIPCIPVSARRRTGLQVLLHTVAQCGERHQADPERLRLSQEESRQDNRRREYALVYSKAVEERIEKLVRRLKEAGFQSPNYRWHALKLLEQDEEITKQVGLDLSDLVDRSYETDLIHEKYDFIEEIVEECLENKRAKAAFADKVDRLLTHRCLGLPIFFGIMAVVFFLTFFIGDWLKGYFENFLVWFSGGVSKGLAAAKVNTVLSSLVVDGIISGVGGIITFLPNIFILFLALAFLEDSGYMARAAYVTDGLMGKLGLSGRAFIPLLLGFGCSVPAVMASRALENPAERKRVIFVTPFMSCSAKLPVYVLFSEIFFGKNAMFAAFSMYLIGLGVGLAAAFGLGRHAVASPLLIELPEYKLPNARTIAINVWDKVKDYLTRAGTTIFLASILVWFLLNFGPKGFVADMTKSFGAGIGMAIAPVLSAAGIGQWQIVLALISGLAAKEVVVSSVFVLFGIGNAGSAAGMQELSTALAGLGFGAENACALMVFVLLYTPCVAALAVIRRELKSAKWMAAMIACQILIAWLMAVAVYQAGSIFF